MTRTASKNESIDSNTEVELAQFHIGIHMGGTVLSSASSIKTPQNPEPAELRLLPMGVLVKYKGERMIVSYSNCIRIKLKD